MKKSKRIRMVNVVLFVCTLELAITAMMGDLHHGRAFGALHGSVGFLFVVFVVIHIVQHWGWVKASFAKSGLKERGDMTCTASH
jgi:hypothetical protein